MQGVKAKTKAIGKGKVSGQIQRAKAKLGTEDTCRKTGDIVGDIVQRQRATGKGKTEAARSGIRHIPRVENEAKTKVMESTEG